MTLEKCIVNLSEGGLRSVATTTLGWIRKLGGYPTPELKSQFIKELLFNYINDNEFIGADENSKWLLMATSILERFSRFKTDFPLPYKDALQLAEKLLQWSRGETEINPQEEKTTARILNEKILDTPTAVLNKRFLNKAYGSAQAALGRAELNAKIGLVSALLANRGIIKGPGFANKMVGAKDINAYVRQYLELLFKDICNYIKTDIVSKYTATTKETYKELIAILDKTLFDDNDTYTGALIKLELAFGNLFTKELFSNNILINATENINKLENVRKLNAYEAWNFLHNFDTLIRNVFGEAINILNNLFNVISGIDKYSISEKGDLMNKTWRINEEIFLDQEVSRLNQRLIDTTPIYDDMGNPTTNYLKFLDFVHVISEIKDLVYNPASANLILNSDTIKSFTTLSELTKKYINLLSKKRGYKEGDILKIKDVSLRDVISSLVENPQLGLAAIFNILSDPFIYGQQIGQSGNMSASYMKSLILSIHHGITKETGESLHAIRAKGTISGTNYYSYITLLTTSIFKNKFMLAYYDNETLAFHLRTLYDYGISNKLNTLKLNILTYNSYHNVNKWEDLINEFNIVHNPNSSDNFIQYDFELNYGGNKRQMRVHVAKNNSIIIEEKNNNTELYEELDDDMIKKSMFEALLDSDGIVEKVLNLNLKRNPNYLKAFLEEPSSVYVTLGGLNYADLFNAFISLTSTVLKNRKVSSDALLTKDTSGKYIPKDNIGLDSYLDTVRKSIPDAQLNRETKEIDLILDKAHYILLKLLATAKAKTEGLGRSSQSKDSENKSLNNSTLSRLIGAVVNLMDIQCKQVDSATNDFSIVTSPGLLQGFYKLHEVLVNGVSKRTVNFTDAEMDTAAFILNFMDGLALNEETNKSTVVGNNIIGLLASVNSDKSFIDFMLVNLNTTLKFNGNKRTYASLQNSEIKLLIAKEIGGAYKKMLGHIQEDYNKLFEFLETDDIIKSLPWAQDLLSWEQELYFRETSVGQAYLQYAKLHNFNESSKSKDFFNWLNISKNNNYHAEFYSDIHKFTDTYASGFSKIKLWVEDYKARTGNKTTAEEYIKLIALRYNLKHRLEPIELVDLLHMNKGLLANNTLLTLIDRFSHTAQAEAFWTRKEAELVKGLLFDGFEYSLSGKPSDLLLEQVNNGAWIDALTNKMIVAKIITNDGKVFNLRNKTDILNLLQATNTNIVEAKDLLNIGLFTINPYIQKWNLFDYYFTQLHLLTSVGSHIAHPSKGFNKISTSEYSSAAEKLAIKFENDLAEEAARFFALHKRNVSLTAAMHEFQLNLLNGVPSLYNIANIQDIKDKVYNIVGQIAGVKPFDGAMFVHPVIVRLENYSLGAEKAGNSKKLFVHFYNARTMNGGIIKTCGFGITNALVRDESNDAVILRMLQKMMWNKWITHTGEEITDKGELLNHGVSIGYADFTKDLFGNSLTDGNNRVYEDIYYFDPVYKKYYKRVFDTTSGQMLSRVDAKLGLVYDFNDIEVDEYGKEIAGAAPNQVRNLVVRSNWDAYTKLFKGQYCQSITLGLFEDGKLHYSETSLDNLTALVNNMGYKQDPNIANEDIEILDLVWQPAKHSDIHYVVTEGAIKLGAANMNSVDLFHDTTGKLNFLRILANQIGIQLDKEHHADNEELSIMNLVIQACSERGFSEEKAHLLYRTLFALTKIGLKTLLEKFLEIVSSDSPNEEFAKSIEYIVKKAILNSGPKDGNLINNLAEDIEQQLRENQQTSLYDLLVKIPFSDPALFSKLSSIVSSFINRSGIKQKLDGVLSVLNPSYNIKRTYAGRLYESYHPEISELVVITEKYGNLTRQINITVPSELLALEANVEELVDLDINKTLSNLSKNITMGAYYRLNGVSEYIRTVEDYHDLKRRVLESYKNGTLTSLKEDIIRGRELSHYNVVYKDNNGNCYNMYDLDSSRMLLNFKSVTVNGNTLEKALKQATTSDKVKEVLEQFSIIIDSFLNSELAYKIPSARSTIDYINSPIFENVAVKSVVLSILLLSNLSNLRKLVLIQGLINNIGEEAYYSNLKNYLLGDFERDLRRLVQRDVKAITHEVKPNDSAKTVYKQLKSLYQEFIIEKLNFDVEALLFKQTHKYLTVEELNAHNHEVEERKRSAFAPYLEKLNTIILKGDPILQKRGNIYTDAVLIEESITSEISKALNNFNDTVKIRDINGNVLNITVDKNSIFIKPYEVIMPKVFKTTLGLASNADILQITGDLLFFYKQSKEKFSNKTNSFDFAFKNLNGNHYYVLNKDHLLSDKFKHLYKKDIDQLKDLDRTKDSFTYMLADGTPIIEMYSNNGTDDEIWMDGDQEIIVTSNPEFYRNKLTYNTIEINLDNLLGNEALLFSFIKNALKGKKRSASKWAKALTRVSNLELNDYVIASANRELSLLELINFHELLKEALTANTEYWDQRLKEEGIEIHTSFLKTLGVTAARIPALSLLSFMPMTVVAFDTADVNSAYVSTSQIWLLGSDYDVDAVSLAMYSLSKSGKFVHWSKYANLLSLSLLNASGYMPFPTGEKANLLTLDLSKEAMTLLLEPYARKGNVTKTQLEVGIAEQKRKYLRQLNMYEYLVLLATENNTPIIIENGKFKIKEVHIDTNLPENERVIAELNGVEQLERLALILSFYDNFGILDITKYTDESGEIVNNDKIDVTLFKSLVDIIDDYNDYINSEDISHEELVLMAKNSVMDGMYLTTLRPINIIESLTSVDLTTDPFKAKSTESAAHKELSTYTPGNVENKIRAIVINLVGKEGIGICAVGTKSFSAWTAYCNHVLNRGTALQQQNLLIPKSSGLWRFGNYRTLANIYALDESTVTNTEVLKALMNVNLDKDAIIDISAMLSLATDNAKELCLGKLNAGTKMIGMYIYGLSVGIPFNEIADLLMSPLGLNIKDLMDGNIFNGGLPSFGTLSSALNHLVIGPRRILRNLNLDTELLLLNEFNKLYKNSYDKYYLPTETYDLLGRVAHDLNIPLKVKLAVLENLKTSLKDINTIKAEIKKEQSKATDRSQDKLNFLNNKLKNIILNNQTLDQLLQYFYQVSSIKYRTVLRNNREFLEAADLKKLEVLAGGADEMKTLGSVLSSNNGVKTKLGESMAFMRKLKLLISNRHQANHERRVRDWYLAPIKTDGEGNTYRINDFGGIYEMPNSLKNNFDFDFVKFMINDQYRLAKILEYEIEKHSVNILDLIDKVDHFKGYLTGVALDFYGKKSISAKYRAIEYLGDRAIDLIKATTLKDIEHIYTKIADLVTDKIREKWMYLEGITINIRPTLHYFDSDYNLIPNNTDQDIKIYLGTPEGDASFKYWMETYVFPNLIKGIQYDGLPSVLLANNEFLRDLQQVITDRTPVHVITNMYSLGINMMPKDDNERALLNVYRNSFNQLEGASKINGFTVPLLIWMYNQIVTLGKPGLQNLTSIFDDFSVKDPLVKKYYNYINDFDRHSDITLGLDVTKDDLIRWAAPIGNTYTSQLLFIYVLDPRLALDYELHEKKDKNKAIPNMDDFDINTNTFLEYDDLIHYLYVSELPYYISNKGSNYKYKNYFLRGTKARNSQRAFEINEPVSLTLLLQIELIKKDNKYEKVVITPKQLRSTGYIIDSLGLDSKNPVHRAIKQSLYKYTPETMKSGIELVMLLHTYDVDNNPLGLDTQTAQKYLEILINNFEIVYNNLKENLIGNLTDDQVKHLTFELNNIISGRLIDTQRIFYLGNWKSEIVLPDKIRSMIKGAIIQELNGCNI